MEIEDIVTFNSPLSSHIMIRLPTLNNISVELWENPSHCEILTFSALYRFKNYRFCWTQLFLSPFCMNPRHTWTHFSIWWNIFPSSYLRDIPMSQNIMTTCLICCRSSTRQTKTGFTHWDMDITRPLKVSSTICHEYLSSRCFILLIPAHPSDTWSG